MGANEPLDRDSPVELWRQAANAIRNDIQAGRLTGRLPSQAKLAEHLGVSVDTIKTAVRVLAGEGLVITTPRKGTYAAPQEDDSQAATELAAHRARVDAVADRVIARNRQVLEILADE